MLVFPNYKHNRGIPLKHIQFHWRQSPHTRTPFNILSLQMLRQCIYLHFHSSLCILLTQWVKFPIITHKSTTALFRITSHIQLLFCNFDFSLSRNQQHHQSSGTWWKDFQKVCQILCTLDVSSINIHKEWASNGVSFANSMNPRFSYPCYIQYHFKLDFDKSRVNWSQPRFLMLT